MPALAFPIQPQEGPILQLELVLPSGDRRRAQALVDTGAKTSVIDKTVARELGVKKSGTTELTTPSTGGNPEPADVYEVGVVLSAHGMEMEASGLRMASADLAAQGVQLLLGRDVLNRLTLLYDGPARRMTLFI